MAEIVDYPSCFLVMWPIDQWGSQRRLEFSKADGWTRERLEEAIHKLLYSRRAT